MRIEQEGEKFVIVRGRLGRRIQRFCFFVDSDSACWTSKRTGQRHFTHKWQAEEDLAELKRRAAARRGTE